MNTFTDKKRHICSGRSSDVERELNSNKRTCETEVQPGDETVIETLESLIDKRNAVSECIPIDLSTFRYLS